MIGKMREPVQQAIERFLDRRVPELRGLSLTWFGGEPLVAQRLLDEHEHVQGLLGGGDPAGRLHPDDAAGALHVVAQRLEHDEHDGWRRALLGLAGGGLD